VLALVFGPPPGVGATVASEGLPATVVDGLSLDVGGTVFRLWGIDGPTLPAECGIAAGVHPCAEAARRMLAVLVDGASVACRTVDDTTTPPAALCTADGADLADLMVLMGWAWPTGPAYTPSLANARTAGRGIWRRTVPGTDAPPR
jgi:endonuclease YncB( thermonuclease family)